jgi:hypothetical protein
MQNTYTVTGMLTDGRTVTLDEALPLGPVKVRIVLEPLLPANERPYLEVVAAIRRRQTARRFRPPSREEVDRSLAEERASWGE